MADWIFQAGAGEHDLDASIAASPRRWWGTPRYRDRIAAGDRVWMQETGPHHPGLYYVATIVSTTYEHPVQPGEPAYARWRTDIRVDYRISPPLLRSELLDDATLGSFRPFHGFQGSNVPVPPDIAAVLSERAAPRLVALARPPRHNHLTRDIKQDGSCPACTALLARQYGSLSAAEAERRDWLDQVPAPEYEPGLGELGDPDPQDSDVTNPEP
jgi:hypothetical protein